MGVRRIKPNILSERFDESRDFYNDVIGLEGGEGLDWIIFFGTGQREVQLSVMKLDIKAHIHPDVSIEVDDVDACMNALKPLERTSSIHSPTKSGACAVSSCAIQTAR
ncbi:MAG TPA: hypothetical protein VIF85_11220 [Gaiellaceae bacterium]